MTTFTDANGDEWEVKLTIASSRPLCDYLRTLDPPVDLYSPAEFYAFVSRVPNAVDALSILCEKQRKKRGMSEEQFGEALYGKYAWEAQRALNEEYLLFYPDPGMSEILRNTQDRLSESSKKEESLVAKFLGQVVENYEQRVSVLANQLDSNTSQDSQEKETSEPDTVG